MVIRTVIGDDGAYAPEEVAVLVSAYENTLKEIGWVEREDPLTLMIARKIMGLRGIEWVILGA